MSSASLTTSTDLPVTTMTGAGVALQLQPMQAEHLAAVAAIETRAHSHPWPQSTFEKRLQQNDCCWVALADAELVGYGIISSGGGDAELLNLSVDPARQRAGIARTLLAAMIARIAPRADNLFLEVRVSNEGAIALYSALDFIEVGTRPNYYPAKSGREDALLMALML